MSKTNKPSSKFVICIETGENDCLETRKVYQVLPDESAAKDDYIRVIDDSGEDYLYPESKFVAVELSQIAEKAFLSTL